ncbi:MAG: hypothetical protein LLH30_00990 [Candidatus Manganitrophus sp. SA1]|nr:hypothetical protein [Candidatus Manganitrophus morganii]
MIKRKNTKTALAKDVQQTNRWGCGCVVFFLVGIVVAMIVAGYLQTRP